MLDQIEANAIFSTMLVLIEDLGILKCGDWIRALKLINQYRIILDLSSKNCYLWALAAAKDAVDLRGVWLLGLHVLEPAIAFVT